MKTAMILEEKKPGVTGRVVALLAGGVVLLAVAVIVLIACGTYVIQQQSECVETTTAVVPRKESSQEFDHDVNANGTAYKEHTIVYEDSRRLTSVNRDPSTGFVASVVFIDFNQGKSVVYAAKSHTCFLAHDSFGSYEEDLARLQAPRPGSNEELRYEVGARVEDSSDLPVEMAPFCTISNSLWLREPASNPEHRQKRDNVYLCTCCYLLPDDSYICYQWLEENGCTLYC